MTAAEAHSICYNNYHDAKWIASTTRDMDTWKHYEKLRDLYAAVLRPGMGDEPALRLLTERPHLINLPGLPSS
jgi:hypothetical protein